VASVGTVLKRALLGRQVSSSKMEHTLLPKVLALPVFSSDPLSSVAYATEEMMLVLTLAGASALSFMLPIAGVIAIVLVIVVTSYIQTVRAYPQGGGSYIVAKENLGTIPGLLAASAILIGYVVTAAVSVTAGAVAVTSAFPGLREHRLTMALSFLTLIALANLRGSKESGLVFAVPTYGFVACIYITVLTGIARCVGGCPQAASSDVPIESMEALSALLVLRAFTSGSAALTGVEAIADGVQAFQRPRAKNAATTLTIMAAISTTMFVGITYLARALHVRPSEHLEGAKSVLAQVGETVFSGGTMFFVLQAFTALILIVAANTAYQDFPRLSAILARDGFMPTQFKNRGDRLVFSNGIILLTLFAAALVLGFSGDLTSLIALYLVGVFTAFTFSQAGMVMRWYRSKEGTWRRNVAINGVGALTTGVVLIVVIVTKFTTGAWIIIVVLPVIILALLGVYRHYDRVRRELARGVVQVGATGSNRVLFILTDVDAAAAEALGYVRAMRPESLSVVYVGSRSFEEVSDRWRELAPSGPDLIPAHKGNPIDNVLRLVHAIPRGPDDFVTVIIPEMFHKRSLLLAALRPVTFRLKVRLLYEPQVVVTDVPLLMEGDGPVGVDGRPLIPERVEALVFVGSVHDATVRAINYAESLNAHETRAIFLATEPEETPAFLQQWAERGIQTPLDVVEAPFRDLGPPLLEEIRRVTADRSTVAAVVLPEFLVTRWWHRILHNNRALFVKRQLLFEERVILSSVPFQLGRPRGS
jgi:amino acid transporter